MTHRVAARGDWGCSLGRSGSQAGVVRAAGWGGVRFGLPPEVTGVAAWGDSGLQPEGVGCSPGYKWLHPKVHRVAASSTQGCSLQETGLQPPAHRVAASSTQGCSLQHTGLQQQLVRTAHRRGGVLRGGGRGHPLELVWPPPRRYSPPRRRAALPRQQHLARLGRRR